MKRILINATHNEEIRVALCKDNHMYDFDLENRTREQKKANIYKAHVTRVEPSLEAVFVEYGSKRQGFLPVREIAKEYLNGNRGDNIRELIKEGDTLIVQIEKEERGNKGAALSTFISLAGRFLVLMPNNPRGGGISRQISGKMREDMKRIVSNLEMPQGMSVIIRTAGIGKTQEDLQHDLNHLLNIWAAIGEQDRKHESPRLVHQEAGVVTRAVRDYLRDDISEIWVDNEEAYNEAAHFISAVMPKQLDKLRKYTDYEPMLARFGIEKQIETAYQREVRLPSGGSIVIDQTEAMVAIDINSAKSKKGADVSGTAYHTNLEAAEEIARQLRLRDMGGLVVIDFIDMYETEHQKEVEKRLIDSTKYDRARVQFSTISKFGLMEMSRQRLRPSLEESTGFKCPRCHGNGMIRDLRSLGLSIMRQIEQMALSKRQGEVQAEVPNDIAAFLLNEKRESLVYLEQDSGTRITILPHSHMESPDFQLHYNPEGFAPSSYERISDSEQEESTDRGYEVNWQTADNERPQHQPTRKPRGKHHKPKGQHKKTHANKARIADNTDSNTVINNTINSNNVNSSRVNSQPAQQPSQQVSPQQVAQNQSAVAPVQNTQAIAWLSNLFAPTPEAQLSDRISSQNAAQAIETLVNQGGQSLGALGTVDNSVFNQQSGQAHNTENQNNDAGTGQARNENADNNEQTNDAQRKQRKPKNEKGRYKKDRRTTKNHKPKSTRQTEENSQEDNLTTENTANTNNKETKEKRQPNSKRESRGQFPRKETLNTVEQNTTNERNDRSNRKNHKPNQKKDDLTVHVSNNEPKEHKSSVIHVSLDDKKPAKTARKSPVKADRSSDNKDRKAKQNKPSDVPNKRTHHKADDETSKETVSDKSRSYNNANKGPVEKSSSGIATIDAVQSTLAIDPQPNTTKQKEVSSEQHKTSITDEKLKSDTVASTDDVTKAPATQAVESTAIITKASATTEPTTKSEVSDSKAAASNTDESKADSSAVEKDSKPNLDTTAIATAQGRALNDPRVVLETLAQQQPAAVIPVLADDSSIVSASVPKKITGTVGSFIREILTNADAQLVQDGVISCFLAAVDQFNASALATTEQQAISNASADNKPNPVTDFDFSNYGYDVLEADYLVAFANMTKANGHFAANQGKTEIETNVIRQRVSNDPRGQLELSTETSNDTRKIADSTDTSIPCVEPKLINKVENETESTEATNSQSVAIDNHAVEDLKEVTVAEPVQQDSERNSGNNTDNAGSKNKERSKTTFDKYKSMLANVSEQMLGNGGSTSLFLSSQPVPKMRTRKVKKDD